MGEYLGARDNNLVELHRELENGADVGEILNLMNLSFRETATWENNNLVDPFLVWPGFKIEKRSELARGMISVARSMLPRDVDAYGTVPDSALWLKPYVRPGDFGTAQSVLLLRQPFGAYCVPVTSYTKKADGQVRQPGEPKEKRPMYVDPRLVQGIRDGLVTSILLFDDVVAHRHTLEDLAYVFKQCGAEWVGAVVGFTKLNQMQEADKSRQGSNLDWMVSCVQVEGVDPVTRKPIIKEWWKEPVGA